MLSLVHLFFVSASQTSIDGKTPLLGGGKYIDMLQSHLGSLHQSYSHGNRKLHLDELLVAYLLCFFNPAMRSLRTIGDWSTLAMAQGLISTTKLCRSTISDANALFDPSLLVPILRQLRSQLPHLRQQDADLQRLLEKVLIVDGSFFNVAADVAWALTRRKRGPGKNRKQTQSKARLDVHLEGTTLLPLKLFVHGKDVSEAQSAMAHIEKDALYIFDRGYVNFLFLKTLLEQGAEFLIRVKEDVNFKLKEELTLDESDRAAGVLSDSLGELTGSPHTRKHLPKQTLREVTIFDEAHPDKPIRLLTSLLDVPAGLLARLYRWRWQIELFFRWLKVHAHFRHMISHSKNGMSLGFHAALIAVLLMYLKTKRPMSKYAFNLLSFVASGLATMEQILPVLEAREKECEKARLSQAKRRQTKKR